MKFRHLTCALGLAGLLSACDPVPKTAQTQADNAASMAKITDNSPVVATVNGTSITEAVLDLYAEQRQGRRPGDPAANERAAILEEVINLELASQKGEQQGIADKLEIALQIEQQRRAVIATAAIKQQLVDNPITDEELRKVYDENVSSGDEYKARHILVKEAEEAARLIAELDTGADFSELAKQHSTGPSGKNGGELGWFSAKQMVQPFTDAVAKLEKGSYTKEPVETQFGWHVIILDDSRQATPPDFEMLKPQISSMVQSQRVQEYIASLREGASIDIVQPPAAAAPAETETDEGEGDHEDAGTATTE